MEEQKPEAVRADIEPPAEPTGPKIEDSMEPSDQIKAQLQQEHAPLETAIPDKVAEQPLPRTEQLILPPKSNRQKYVITLIVLLLIAIATTAYFLVHNKKSNPGKLTNASLTQTATTTNTPATAVQGLQLDPAKNYGNKYASGILPVGDGKYVTDAPKTGYIYACSGYANNLKADSGGAMVRGPWFVNNNTQYDINKKLHVQGAVTWQASFSNKISGTTRTIITNDLPDHTTGVFPISPSDPAYAYDRNPNSIKGQTFTYALSADPSYGDPTCIGGQVGIMLTGVALFSAFDAGGRDAGAWEVQDSCSGHPEKEGIYHYHTLSSCIKDTSVKTVIGFALDGFPITGPQVGTGNMLTTADLDECHGLTSSIVLDGKTVTMYHYVMTQDFPYSVSCYRGAAIQPPGQASGDQQTPPPQP